MWPLEILDDILEIYKLFCTSGCRWQFWHDQSDNDKIKNFPCCKINPGWNGVKWIPWPFSYVLIRLSLIKYIFGIFVCILFVILPWPVRHLYNYMYKQIKYLYMVGRLFVFLDWFSERKGWNYSRFWTPFTIQWQSFIYSI